MLWKINVRVSRLHMKSWPLPVHILLTVSCYLCFAVDQFSKCNKTFNGKIVSPVCSSMLGLMAGTYLQDCLANLKLISLNSSFRYRKKSMRPFGISKQSPGNVPKHKKKKKIYFNGKKVILSPSCSFLSRENKCVHSRWKKSVYVGAMGW